MDPGFSKRGGGGGGGGVLTVHDHGKGEVLHKAWKLLPLTFIANNRFYAI